MKSDWLFCFSMEAGKTYHIRYVYNGASEVRDAILTYNGEKLQGTNIPIVVAQPDDNTAAGMMQILSIGEIAADGKIK